MDELIQDLCWLAEKHRNGSDDHQRVARMIYSILGALERGGITELYNLVHEFTLRDIKRISGMIDN